MSLWRQAFERAVGDDPLRYVADALELLMAHTGANHVGVFLAKGEPEFFAGHGVDQASLDWVRATWRRQRASIRAGEAVEEPRHCAIPLALKDPMLPFAFLYLGAEMPFAVDQVRKGLESLHGSLELAMGLALSKRAVPHAIDDFLQSTPRETILRRQLEGLLHSHEWNVARVARVLGVTRQTVYTRMDRLGIPRLRVPKS